jgi:phage terminase large subunit
MAENYRTTALNKLQPLFNNGKRFLIVQGGMRAGKTYPILMLITSWCQQNPDQIATIASMSYPHLSRGAIRDFQNIMKAAEIWEPERWNQSSKIETFSNGTIMEFISVDNMSAHGPARNLLFVNEANDMDRETFEQLAARTTGKIIIDYNPTHEFWAHTWLLKEHADECDFIILTYKDNEALAPTIRQYIESKKPKPGEKPSNWWTVYGLGQIGTLEGNIYEGWRKATPEDYKDAKLIRYGLDFGFSNDETGMVAIYQTEDGRIIIEQKLYQTGLLGSQYGDKLRAIGIDPNILIVADSARPEIIAEIKAQGFRIIGADKNAGSVLRGIDRVKQHQIIYDGKDIEREYLSYQWRTRRSGETLDEPQDGNDHLMDALRYAIDDMNRKRFDF